jgi:hypothetical protein
MNEQLVKDLAIKAKLQMVSEPRLQEFAELMVAEFDKCIDVATKDCCFTTFDQAYMQRVNVIFKERLKATFG